MAKQPGREQGAAAPQYSPDRRWWWNGQEWQPVSQQPLQPPAASQRIRPGRWLYLVAMLAVAPGAALLVIGLLVFFQGFPPEIANATRVTAPGTSQVQLTVVGTYMISYEHPGSGKAGDWSLQVSNETKPNIPSEVSSMQLNLVSTVSPAAVSIQAPSGGYYYTYSVGNREGVVIGVFSVNRPDTYSLTSHYASGQSQPQIVLTIAQGSPDHVFTSHLYIPALRIFGGLGLVLVGLTIGTLTLGFRIRAKNRPREIL